MSNVYHNKQSCHTEFIGDVLNVLLNMKIVIWNIRQTFPQSHSVALLLWVTALQPVALHTPTSHVLPPLTSPLMEGGEGGL